MRHPNCAAGAPPPLPKFIHPDDMPDRYALTGTGTCMQPLITDGSLVAFDKTQKPMTGDLVGLIFTPEAAQRRQIPGMIKRLVLPVPELGQTGHVTVEQINPHRRYKIRACDVLAVHKCIGIPERTKDGARLRLATRETA